MRTVHSVCHRFHRDFSFGLHEGARPAGRVLLPRTIDDFDDSVLGDPISYARCEQFPGSESPSLCLCVGPSGLTVLLDPPVLQTV